MARQKNDGRGRLGGRQKGTPNKTTSAFRSFIEAQWRQYQESGLFSKDIEEMDPATRAVVMEKYAQYIAPKMKTADLNLTQAVTLTIEDRLRELSGEEDETDE